MLWDDAMPIVGGICILGHVSLYYDCVRACITWNKTNLSVMVDPIGVVQTLKATASLLL